MQTDGQIDVMKSVDAFRGLANAPETDKLHRDLSVVTICVAKLYL